MKIKQLFERFTVKTTVNNKHTEVPTSGAVSDVVGYDAEGGYVWRKINGTKTKVYTKYFTGTTDNGGETLVAHGCDYDKILCVSASVKGSNSSYHVCDFDASAEPTYTFRLFYGSTNVNLNAVSAALQVKAYNIRIDYTL